MSDSAPGINKVPEKAPAKVRITEDRMKAYVMLPRLLPGATPAQYTVNTNEAVVWSIIGDTAKITSQSGNMCMVKEVDSGRFGVNTLRVELVTDSSMYAEKEIEIVFL